MAALFRGQDEIAQKLADRVRVAPVVPITVGGPVDLAYGQNVRPGSVRAADECADLDSDPSAIPYVCVFIVPMFQSPIQADIGGMPPSTQDVSDWAGIYPDSFQIVARGKPDDEDTAFDLADACVRALDNGETAEYFAVTVDSRPSFLQRDDAGSFEFVFTVTAKRCQ